MVALFKLISKTSLYVAKLLLPSFNTDLLNKAIDPFSNRIYIDVDEFEMIFPTGEAHHLSKGLQDHPLICGLPFNQGHGMGK